MINGQTDLASDYDRNLNGFVERGTIKPDQIKIVWKSDPLPNDPLVVRKDLDPALVAKVQQIVLEITDEQAKSLLPKNYTGWVKATHDNYKLIEDAGIIGRAAEAEDELAVHGTIGRQSGRRGRTERLRFGGLLIVGVAFYVACLRTAEVDFGKLWSGLPRLANWAARAWPPDLSEVGTLLVRAAETVAMGTVGTSFGAALAVPLCVLAARNLAPGWWAYAAARAALNALRGIDSFIFALIFVAAVGLGPFAGVLGLACHVAGSIAKLWSETLEAVEPGPIEAVTMSGASQLRIIRFARVARRAAGTGVDRTLHVGVQRACLDHPGRRRRRGNRPGAEEQRRPAAVRPRAHDSRHHPRDGHRHRYHQRLAPPPHLMTALLKPAASASATAIASPCATCRSRLPPASSSPCSGRAARARRRCCDA